MKIQNSFVYNYKTLLIIGTKIWTKSICKKLVSIKSSYYMYISFDFVQNSGSNKINKYIYHINQVHLLFKLFVYIDVQWKKNINMFAHADVHV